MAGEGGTAVDPLAPGGRLQAEPYRFGYFQVLRAIEQRYPALPRLGRARRPQDEPLRLGQEPSLAFAPATLASYDPAGEGVPAVLRVFFFGLFGPNGPLPLHLTEHARQRLRQAADPTFARFADIFHHRLLCLFYRAWADAEPVVAYDRPDQDRFRTYVGSLSGRGTPGTWRRDTVPDEAKLFYAGHLSLQTRHASGLEDILGGYFDMPVCIEQLVGGWLPIPEDGRFRLGESPDTGTLGVSTILGGRVWSCAHRFRIVAGPLSLDRFESLLPGRDELRCLADLTRNVVGDELGYEMRLVLSRHEVPGIALDGRCRLGFTSWLITNTPDSDPGDVVLDDARCRAS